MGKYIKVFNTISEYNTYINGTPTLPNVSYCKDNLSVHYNPYVFIPPNYLSFRADGTATLKITNNGDNAPNIEYSFDALTFTTWDYTELTIPDGATVYLRGNNPTGFSKTTQQYSSFSFGGTGNVYGGGNVMSLIGYDDLDNLLTIPQSSDGCFRMLFYYPGNLITPPELPATTLAVRCYYSMFQGCSRMTTAPSVLPAKRLEFACYNSMFINCKFATAPHIMAERFLNTSLSCVLMFYGCTNLNYIKADFLDLFNNNNFNNWVVNVQSSGTFVKNADATWENTFATDAIPTGWTVITE